jgi:hypothetical protein
VVVSTLALFFMLSGAAVAQDIPEVPVEDIQSAKQYIDDLSTTDLTLQASSEPAVGEVVTAKPSEAPWLTDQQRGDPEATSAQIANEVEQISEANQPLMEDDLSTIAPVQEPLPTTGTESVTVEPVADVPEISSSTPEGADANSASATTSEPVASDPIDGTQRFKPPPGINERQLLGLEIIVVSFVLPGLIVLWNRPPVRVGVLDIIRDKSKQTHHIPAAEPKSSRLRAERITAVSRRCRRHCAMHVPRRRDHRKYK